MASSLDAAEMSVRPDTYNIPYHRVLPWVLREGLEARLDGSIPQHSKGFTVQFRCAQYEGADISLEFNLRFEGPPPSSSAIVTLNSYENQTKGKEEKLQSTLRQGQHFRLQFIIANDGYKIMENDRPLGEFRHRLPRHRTRYLHVDGEVKLSNLKFI